MTTVERFDGYELAEPIGAGGMAEVFRARRLGAREIHRDVCIKRIRREMCCDAGFSEMFTDEARISMALRHPNIVAVEHFGEHAGTLYMAMEWVHGVNLSELHKTVTASGRTIPTWAVCFILGEVLAGLHYAHAKVDARGQWLQIVHRDVSPHNVMVSFAGEVKLADFGIAKATSRLHQTAGAVIKGKVAYLAPEQATSGILDGRTDLFALGVTAYEMLAGCLPHQGPTPTAVLVAALHAQHRPLHTLRPDLPAGLARRTPEAVPLLGRNVPGRPPVRTPSSGRGGSAPGTLRRALLHAPGAPVCPGVRRGRGALSVV